MKNIVRLALQASALVLFLSPLGLHADEKDLFGDALAATRVVVNKTKDGVALQGYDAVAYFTDNKAVEGSPKFRSRYKGATYQFASEQHKAMFDAAPAKYEPQFGGYCGYAASINRLSPIDPKIFQVLDGRLVLQHNQKAWNLWNEDVPANLAKADANWPGLVERNGTGGKVLVNVDKDGVALEGHDPVAYFTVGKPVAGDKEIDAVYNGAKYYFSSKENRETFERAPAHYAPQFGGFCGYAASINKVSPVDINLFQIIDDRLVLQHTPKAYTLFNEDPQANLKKADQNWPGLTEKNGH